MNAAPNSSRGLALGLLGVVIFAMTLPMTRLAVGDAAHPQLPPAFVTAGRAAVAGLLSLLYLAAVRAPRPARALWPALAVSALGTVVGFPLGIALALREVQAMHAAVVTGVLPLATALLAAWVWRQRPSAGFWACAVTGCALVLAFAAWQGGGHLVVADGWLLLAVVSAAVGYVAGARASAGPDRRVQRRRGVRRRAGPRRPGAVRRSGDPLRHPALRRRGPGRARPPRRPPGPRRPG